MLADLVPVVALVVLLLVAYRQPRGGVEAGCAVIAAAACLLTGVLDGGAVADELRHLGPVVGFLTAILVVADRCRAEGLFAALAARLARVRDRRRLLLAVFALAAAVTVVLSLDATVVLLTPVVLATSAAGFLPGELACVRLANSASLLVPVANLTNLLAMSRLDLTFGRFALLMAPTWVFVLLVEYAALRLRHRRALGTPVVAARPSVQPLPRVPLLVLALMVTGFVVASPLGIAPVWVALAAAAALVGHALLPRRGRPGMPWPVLGSRVVRSAQLPFAVFVLGLGVVVASLGAGWFGELTRSLVPARTDLLGLVAVAAIGVLLANLVNNLPATLLLVPVVAPLGTTALLALLIGVNVGSSLTWTGSLANLLWRRTLVAAGRPVPGSEFHRAAALVVPPAVLGGVLILWAWQPLVG